MALLSSSVKGHDLLVLKHLLQQNLIFSLEPSHKSSSTHGKTIREANNHVSITSLPIAVCTTYNISTYSKVFALYLQISPLLAITISAKLLHVTQTFLSSHMSFF